MRRAAPSLGFAALALIVLLLIVWWFELLPVATPFDGLRPNRGPVELTVACGAVGQDLELCREIRQR